MVDPTRHTRVSNIFLGRYEQAALRWLTKHLPFWVSSDLMMLLGLVGAFMTALGYVLTLFHPAYLWLATLGLILNWLGDSMDGTLARERNTERPRYGYFMDHSLDVLGGSAIGVGIGVSPYVEFEIALLAVIGYLLMSMSVHIRTQATGMFVMSYGRFGTTEIRVLMVLANTAVFFVGNPVFDTSFFSLSAYDLVGIVIASMEIVLFVIVTLTVGLGLRKEESREN